MLIMIIAILLHLMLIMIVTIAFDVDNDNNNNNKTCCRALVLPKVGWSEPPYAFYSNPAKHS